MNNIYSRVEYISPAFLEIIQNLSDQPEINEQIFFMISYIAHKHFKISLIYKDKSIVGYYFWKVAQGDFLKRFRDLRNLNDKVDANKKYFFLMNFEIFKQYRNRGFGTRVIRDLKIEQEKLGNELLISTNYDCKGFWEKVCPECLIITLNKDVINCCR